jgi:hypothetical protein
VAFPVRTTLVGVLASLAVLVFGAFIAMERGWARTFEAPYPPVVA